MFGGDLPSNDAFTDSLLTNDEALAANQQGAHSRKLSQQGDAVILTSDVGGKQYYAAFNLGEIPDLLITIPGTTPLRDVWERRSLTSRTIKLEPHSAALLAQ
jgi:hypothetical protein